MLLLGLLPSYVLVIRSLNSLDFLDSVSGLCISIANGASLPHLMKYEINVIYFTNDLSLIRGSILP